MKFRAELIISRTYATAVFEADDDDQAREIAKGLTMDDIESSAEDNSIDVIDVYTED